MTVEVLALQVSVTVCCTGALTVTVAKADFVVSATLVALTVYVPAVEGAVYRPLVETVPPLADQVAAVLLVPLTVAENCWVPLVNSEALVGEIEIATTVGAVTLTVAEANLLVSATEVARTM